MGTSIQQQPLYANPWFHRILIALTAFLFYQNTLRNGFVMDDLLVITQNRFVKEGFRGIPDILTHDSFYGASGKIAKASGGRYRPLSVVTFAIERDLFGPAAYHFHFTNVLIYVLLCLLLYQFLIRHVFRERNLAAFVAVFLFAIQPLHTEVVANLKSRDELLSLFFIIATLHFLLRYLRSEKRFDAVIAACSLVLALLSKEYGVIMIAVIPITVYCFSDRSLRNITLTSLPYLILIGAYIWLRWTVNRIAMVEEKDLMNEPYLLATASEKYATILFVLLRYIRMLFWPVPMSYDYSYNQIPYVPFNDPTVILSAVLYAAMVIYSVVLVFKKQLAGYFLLLYLFAIFVVSNILINIGTPLADRFTFGPGLFFTVALILTVSPFFEKIRMKYKSALLLLLIVPALPAFTVVRERNKDWDNNKALYFKDVRTAWNSCRAQAFCGMDLVTSTDGATDSVAMRQTLHEANEYFRRAYAIYPSFGTMYQNWGLSYYRLDELDSAAWAWTRYRQFHPDGPFNDYNTEALGRAWYNRYVLAFRRSMAANDNAGMLSNYREAVRHYDKLADGWLWLGKIYALNRQNDSALYSWNRCLQLDPANKEAKELISNIRK